MATHCLLLLFALIATCEKTKICCRNYTRTTAIWCLGASVLAANDQISELWRHQRALVQPTWQQCAVVARCHTFTSSFFVLVRRLTAGFAAGFDCSVGPMVWTAQQVRCSAELLVAVRPPSKNHSRECAVVTTRHRLKCFCLVFFFLRLPVGVYLHTSKNAYTLHTHTHTHLHINWYYEHYLQIGFEDHSFNFTTKII